MKDPELALEIRARRAVAAGNPALAWGFLRRRLKASPADAELHLLAAWLLEELGKPREALRHCRAALALEGKVSRRPEAPKLKGLRVLVAGAGGFVGRRLVERLLARGAVVNALLRPNSAGWGLLRPHPRLFRHPSDLTRPASLARAAAGAKAQAAVYLAKHRGGGGGAAADRRLSLNFAQALRGAGRTQLLVRAGLPVSAEADQALAEKAASVSGAAVATPKLGRVYGPDASLDSLGVNSGGLRDYLFVEEAAEAFLRALLRPGGAGLRLEIRSGVFLTGEQAEKTFRAVRDGRSAPSVRSHPRDPQSPAALAQALLGWRPRLSLADGLRRRPFPGY